MAWQIRQSPLFPVSILQKQRQIYLLFQKSLKNDCSNLYFHLYNFNMSYKFFAYLMSLSRRGPVNQSTPIWQKQRQIYLLLGNSVRNGNKNPFLLPKHFQFFFKANSCLMSISRLGRVNPSAPTFPNINLRKTINNFLVILKITEKCFR